MKKLYVDALATLSAISGAAFAQSSVTLYGVVDLGLMSSKATIGTATYKQTAMSNGVQSGGRIGFKGTEDLGGGLKANFVVENGITPDDSTTAFGTSNRQSFVNLEGGFGTVALGRQYTLHHSNQGAGDMVGNISLAGYLGSMDSLVRQSNAVTYTSPSFSGVTVAAQMGFGETITSGSTEKANDQTALRVAYASGPLTAGLAYETVKNGTTSATKFLGQEVMEAMTYGKRKTMNISATYDLGMAKIGFVNNNTKFDNMATVATADVASVAVGNTKWAANTLSVAAPFGAVTAFASFGAGKVTAADGSTSKSSAYQLGASYALSKRTNMYAFTGQTKLKDVDAKLGQTVVGVRHQF